jgi:hypothetical protein
MMRTGLFGQAVCARLPDAIKNVAVNASIDWAASLFEGLNERMTDFLENLKGNQPLAGTSGQLEHKC